MENQLREVAARIKELREISGFTVEQMAEKTEVSVEEYRILEQGEKDYGFTFIYKCAAAFGVEIKDLLEGSSPNLSLYTVTRKGEGLPIARKTGFDYHNLAPSFKNKSAEPFWVKVPYVPGAEMVFSSHAGQEIDIVIKGKLMIQINERVEILTEGDTIYYNSSAPHALKALDGKPCELYAIVLEPRDSDFKFKMDKVPTEEVMTQLKKSTVADNFIECDVDESGVLQDIRFKNADRFNFGFDCVDKLAAKSPQKLAMLWVGDDKREHRFTFSDIKKYSNMTANYFESLGIKKGDRVMLVLKRHYQFWFAMLGLNKLGAIAIPATNQLQEHDFEYRFQSAGISAIICTADGDTAHQAEIAMAKCSTVKHKIMVGAHKDSVILDGWRNFDEEYTLYSSHYKRGDDAPGGDDLMLMFFTSGTSGYPKIAAHNYKYALGHFHTARYWHCVEPDGLHFTISDTGWAKAMWGKLYGQWLCEAATFVYDFDRFDAATILPMFAKHHITTFCAPPTMLRMMIKEDISHYDLSSVRHMTTAGEALNPEVYRQFEKATGLQILEGFGQSESTMIIGNLQGAPHKIGSMGKPAPIYDVDLLDADGKPVPVGETGEIVIRVADGAPCGLFTGYYNSPDKTAEVWYDGYYHTGDTAWRDEDGFYWFVGRVDDVIKSSGYRIGPFEIESVIMELPYVLECGVSAEPDEVRGQVVKASIVLCKGTEPTDELKKEIQRYVKDHTAPYKYPRIVVFRDSLPKTTSGKIQRNKL